MPQPKATELALSARQAELLTRIWRRRTSPQQQVERASIIGVIYQEVLQGAATEHDFERLREYLS